MDDTLTIIITILASAGAIVIAIGAAIGVALYQGGKHEAANAATNVRIDNLSAELRNEIRELGYRIENRINLDERVRDVEQRTADDR